MQRRLDIPYFCTKLNCMKSMFFCAVYFFFSLILLLNSGSGLATNAFNLGVPANPNAISDTLKLYNKKDSGDLYIKLADYFESAKLLDSSALFCEKALKVFETEKRYDQIYNCFQQLAMLYLDLGEYSKCSEIRIKQLELSKKLKLPAKIAQSHHEMGYLYFFMGEYDLSLENYIKAMDIYKNEKLEYDYNVTNYYCALLYFEIGDYENCEKLLQQSLSFFRIYEAIHIDDTKPSYTATIYKRLALLDIEKENYKRGIVYCDSAFSLLKDGASIGWVYDHRGVIYTKLNNYKKATENFALSKKYAPQCDHCYWPIYTDISEYFLHFGMLDSAIYYCNKTLERAITYRYDIRILRTYKVMAKVYETKGEYKKAYEFMEKYNDLYQKALNKRKLAMLKNAEHKKLGERNMLLENENQEFAYSLARQRLILIFSAITALILSILFFILFKNQKQKQRLLKNAKKMEVIQSRIAGQEEERTRIARELHDGIAADITGIRINLNNLTSNSLEPYPVSTIINKLINIGNEIRAISHNLASPNFTDTTLEEITRSFIHQFIGKEDLQIKLSVYPKIDWAEIDFAIQKELYRIFQEVVNNTVKYSFATELSVQIVKQESCLSLIFDDNGKGFAENKTDGIGLKNIKKRVEMLKGDIEITSTRNMGCSISIEVPLTMQPKFALS